MTVSSSSDNPIFNLAEQIAAVYNANELQHLCQYLNYHALSKLEQTGLLSSYAYKIVEALHSRGDLNKLQQGLQNPDLNIGRANIDWKPLFAPFHTVEPPSDAVPDLPPKPPQPPLKPKPPSPYKGLSFYTKEDAALFFGRDRLVKDLLARLPNPLDPSVKRKPNIVNFLPIIGASGSGKSSLVRAGMLPKLEAKGWHVCIIRPDKNPLRSLLEIAPTVAQADTLDTMLDNGKANALDLALLDYRKANTPFLLVIDQFEELFTTLPPKPSDENDTNAQKRYDEAQAQRQLFIANLMHAVESANNGMTTVLITLRADFLSQRADYPQLWDAINRNKPELVLAMQRKELTDAIRKPAEARGFTISDQLITTILRDCGVVQPTDISQKGILPLLSHALDQM